MSDCSEILSNDGLDEPTSLIVSRLVEILGARLCAVIGDVKNTSTVREWIDGKEPSAGRSRILRFALRVAGKIERRCGSGAAQSWFQGANHALADEAPAIALKRTRAAGDVTSVEQNVVLALRELLDI
jgi:hypothetical protein